MRNTLNLILVASSLVALTIAANAQTPATLDYLADGGGYAIPPTPGPDDQSQLTTPQTTSQPPGLNYYVNTVYQGGQLEPAQTFTTGSNTNGYILNSLSIYDSGDSSTGDGIANGQPYLLNLYTVSGSNATLYASYISSDNVVLYDYYWYQWTNLGVPLLPNTQYAYSFGETPSGDSGWANLGNMSNDLYSAGQIAEIPLNGGTMVFCASNGWDASFNLGLTPATSLAVAVAVSPGYYLTSGTPVTITANAGGPGTYHYQWQTDGGSGGTMTNIPSATNATLSVDTTHLAGRYQYAVVVTNGTGSATISTAFFVYQSGNATLTDVGTQFTPGEYDISQLSAIASGNAYDGLNYYDDNVPSPGQTFVTGTNSQGYYLTSVALKTGGGSSGHTAEIKSYNLYIYSVSGNNATLLAQYSNTNFLFTYGDWLNWSGFPPLFLKPNMTYAYAFHLVPDSVGGWAGMGATNNNPYANGQMCLIGPNGGTITFGPSGTYDAAFSVGLAPIGIAPTTPFANSITFSPSASVTNGTQVTLNEAATGATPFNYQWRTDGGSGGVLTNILSSNTSNLVVNTTSAGVFRYDVIVSNTYGSSTSAVASLTVFYPAATATLTDIGSNLPMPAPGNISQTNPASAANNPDGLNYYYNNDTPPGQTFTTGSNLNGYILNTVAIDLAGNANLAAQTYVLRIYSISGGIASLYATYNSQSGFLVSVATDCLQWSGLALPLSPNTTYAYTLYGGAGWDNLANVSGNPYSGGEVCLIPPTGGVVTYGSSHDYDGVFDLGLSLFGYPVVSPITFSPSSSVDPGMPVTASANVSGTGPFTYQWQTDGGSGPLASIPGATNSTLSINTTGLAGLTVGCRLIASNGSGTTTGAMSQLTIGPNAAPAFSADITNSIYQLSSQVTTFVGGDVTLSDTNFHGTFPIAYQWQFNSGGGYTNILGATNNTLTLSNLAVSASGSYQLLANNSQGSAQTSAANLTVMPQPTNSFIVNFQFHTLVNADVGNYIGPGVVGTGTYWNQVMGTTNFDMPGGYYTSTTGYSDDGITNHGISWTVICDNSWGFTATPAIPLLDSAANAYAPGTFLFTLPNGLYNLVLFSCNGDQAGNGQGNAEFVVNGIAQDTAPTTDTSFILNDNYVVYSNLVVTSGAALTGTWTLVNSSGFGSLNGAQLQYIGAFIPLSIQATNNQLRLQWSPGTLLEATNLAGPWTTNSASSPYLLTPSGTQKFFRVRLR